MHFEDFALNRLWHNHIAKPPTAHRVSFGESEKIGDVVLVFRHRSEIEISIPIFVRKMGIGIIQQDH